MATLFRLDGSVRPDSSDSRRLADVVEAEAARLTDGLIVTRRDLGREPVPATLWAQSLAALGSPEALWTPDRRAAHGTASSLASELEQADAYLIAAPLYNWGVSQYVKTWVDVVMTTGRLGPRGSSIAGRPAVLVITRGGDYRNDGGHPEWDWATGWLRRILHDIWQLDLTVVEQHLTLAPHRDYLAHLRDDAALESDRAARSAVEAAQRLASR